MLSLIIFIVIFYIFYRLLTSYIIPKISKRNLDTFKEKYKRNNPQVFNKHGHAEETINDTIAKQIRPNINDKFSKKQ